MTALAAVSLANGPEAARSLLDRDPLGTVELPRPSLVELPYRDLVHALLGRQGFKLDFNRLDPDSAIALVCDRILGPGAFQNARASFAADIASLAHFVGGLADARPAIAIRTYFAPGDLVWHVDRVNERTAFRLVWPIGRPAGMRVTSADNIEPEVYRAFMRREYPQLCRLDTRVMRTGEPVERLWAHRPQQIEAMRSGRFPFLRASGLEGEVSPGAASIHRVQTPAQPGTWHRSSWANRHAPGLQVVITVASDA